MRTITNDYKDAQILNLGSEGERGPYLVTQTGVAPSDPLPKTRMFVLRPDGNWVDFNGYASQGKPEAMIANNCFRARARARDWRLPALPVVVVRTARSVGKRILKRTKLAALSTSLSTDAIF